jgi:hypothetical protein
MESEPSPEAIRKRVKQLRIEIAGIQDANVSYAMLSYRSSVQRAADRERKNRLERIVEELAFLSRAKFSI